MGDFDWSRCFLCQAVTSESLRCPMNSKRGDAGVGYRSILNNIENFAEIDSLPIQLHPNFQDNCKDESILKAKEAKYHKSCSLKFSADRVKRAQKRSKVESHCEPLGISNKKVKRQSERIDDVNCKTCFFCGEGSKASAKLHMFSTIEADEKVRISALAVGDVWLSAKLSFGDLPAQDAMYHKNCLTGLYNRVRSVERNKNTSQTEALMHGIALAEVVTFIEEGKNCGKTSFKMCELVYMYDEKLKQLGGKLEAPTHTSRLKERILREIPQLGCYKNGRENLLAFEEDVGPALVKAAEQDKDGMILSRAAKLIRKDVKSFKEQRFKFEGSFEKLNQEACVPKSLLLLVQMILHNITENTSDFEEKQQKQASHTIAQLLMFNSSTSKKQPDKNMYHSREREPPVPIYTALKIHAKTRCKELIESMYDLGLCISYPRMMTISTCLANSVCKQYEQDGYVCPTQVNQGVFILGGADNVDHNPSSTTASDSFHGTAISLFGYRTTDNPGAERKVEFDSNGTKVSPLPEAYTDIKPVICRKDVAVPKVNGPFIDGSNLVKAAKGEEQIWLKKIHKHLSDPDSRIKNISWAAHHADLESQQQPDYLPASCALLPLFREPAASHAMIKHSMDIIMTATHKLNPGQIPVMTVDQPLYAIAKTIQWNFPVKYGEDKLFVLLGGLHIEKAALDMVGDWLEETGWTAALTKANVASAGKAESFLKASHITRTRYSHQVTAAALYILMNKAYDEYCDSVRADEKMPFEDWCTSKAAKHPQFKFWFMTLDLELTILVLVRAFRQGKLQMLNAVLTDLSRWFDALDHSHYARWLPVQIRDFNNMPASLKEEFESGKFVIHKTTNPFSGIAVDQAHEQHNKLVKGQGGAIGLTENQGALLKWTVAGPEIARVIQEFEDTISTSVRKDSPKHHEQNAAFQKRFSQDVRSMVSTITGFSNPFAEDTTDLYVLDTKDIMEKEIVDTVYKIEAAGHQHFDTFIKDRLVECTIPLMDVIKKNKFPLFSRPVQKESSPSKMQVSSLKQNVALFSQLYIGCQTRGGNLEDFFTHENQPYPPALSKFGQLRACTKADLLKCLEYDEKNFTPPVDSTIVDGAAMVNASKPDKCTTFEDYSNTIFIPKLKRLPGRVDVVWDRYQQHSLKEATRIKRGKGVRRRVCCESVIPNWQSFLRVDGNKTELFSYLGKEAVQKVENTMKVLVTTVEEKVSTNSEDVSLQDLYECNHEEADTRMVLHAEHQVKSGYRKILVKSPDTDVIVLFISLFSKIGAEEIWVEVAFSHFVPIHEIQRTLGPEKSGALLFFHSFTGCDTVSSFSSVGKKTAWKVWENFPEVTSAFQTFSNGNEKSLDDHLPMLEQFVILCYDVTSQQTNINTARQQLFAKGRQIDNIPPTLDALKLHIMRAILQAGYTWSQSLKTKQELPSSDKFGWQKGANGKWEPLWTLLPDASKACRELLKCNCRVRCTGRCQCNAANLKCTPLCKCGGGCYT